jgi:hypothetical protein
MLQWTLGSMISKWDGQFFHGPVICLTVQSEAFKKGSKFWAAPTQFTTKIC